MRIIYFFSLVVLLYSCSSLRHYKYIATDPHVTSEKKEIIAPKVAILFPAREIFIPGQVIIKTDTIVDVEQTLQMAEIIDSLLFLTVRDSTNRDSIARAILSRFKPRTVRVVQTSIDTIQVPNTAKEYALMHDLEVCGGEVAQLKGDKSTLERKVTALEKEVKEWYQDRWFWFFVVTFIALVISIIIHFKR